MIAFDTCILVRFLAADDPAQADAAEALMRTNTVFLPDTVLLETEWVLRSRYQKARSELLEFFSLLLALENVVLEDTAQFEKTLEWYSLGADFADAMHLAACGQAVMHTFDHGFCKHARESGLVPAMKVVQV
jgi:predicted nucleic-acid-binding protein